MLVSTKSASLFSTGSTSHSTIWVWARTTASGISPALASTATLWWRQARRPEAISTQSAGGDSTGSTTLASVRICCWILTLFINVAHSSITTWSSEVWWWSWCSSLYVPEGSFVLKFKICYYKTTFIFNFIFTTIRGTSDFLTWKFLDIPSFSDCERSVTKLQSFPTITVIYESFNWY